MALRCRRACLALAMILLGPLVARAADTQQVSAQTFFRQADLIAAKLAPNGRWLAVASGIGGARARLIVIDLDRKTQPSTAAAFSDADIDDFHWVNDDRLVFTLSDRQSGAADANIVTRELWSVRKDGLALRELVTASRRSSLSPAGLLSTPLHYNHRLLSVPQTGGDEIIVGEMRWDRRGDIERVHPLRLNVVTGRAHPIAVGSPDRVQQWLFDPKGEPRIAVRLSDGDEEVFWRGPGDAGWRLLVRQRVDTGQFIPAAVDGDGQLIVRVTAPSGEFVLKRFNFRENGPESDPLVSAPGFDLLGTVLTDWSSHKPLGVRVNSDAESTAWFDPALRSLQAQADTRFSGRVNRLSCLVCSTERNVLVYSYSDQDPGSYWILRSSDGSWESVGKTRADVDPQRMARLDFHRVKARDGNGLPVWVTGRPSKAESPRPAIVLVHSGPWQRGVFWRWNSEAQFLASRGYVVIEPEFRGSVGYGDPHFKRGFKQWGAGMQDDVADAVLWAAEQGWVDKERVCIAGSGYGGYAALMGMVRHPGLYRCGVTWTAITDPALPMMDAWFSSLTHDQRKHAMPEMIGDPSADADLLRAASPIDRAREIRGAVFIGHGRADPRVPIAYGDRMREALRAAGTTHEWIVYDDEMQVWVNRKNRIDFWQRAETFLDRHLR